jgi:rod shape-determining protein MreD
MMMSHLVTACLIYLSLVLQSCVASDIAIHSFRPWFPGLVLAACVLRHGNVAGIVWAGILGFAVDGLSAERLGVHLVVTTFVAMGLLVAREESSSYGTMLTGIFVFAGTLIWRLASMTTHATLAGRDLNVQETLSITVGDAVYSSAITVVFTMLFLRLWRVSGRGETSTSISLKNRWTMLTR